MKDTQKNILRFLSCVVLLLIAYLPTLKSIVHGWTAPESYYGHGFLVPLASLFVVWHRRGFLKAARLSTENTGLFIVAIGIIVHIICAALKVYFISGVSFVFVLYGLVLFFFGKEITRNLIFPIFFLLAMIPLPLAMIGVLTIKLKLLVAEISVLILNNIGFPSILDGSTIRMPASYLIIEAPCSGLRSLISLITVGLLFALAMKLSYLKKGVLFLLSVPIAIATNVLRIVMLSVVNDLYGEKVAMGFFHDFTGFLVFALAFAGFLLLGSVLKTKANIES